MPADSDPVPPRASPDARPEARASAGAPRPTCRAHGIDRYHHAARAELSFGPGGWFAILNGASGTPREIAFTCSACGETFETTRDPAVLREFRRYPYVDRTVG